MKKIPSIYYGSSAIIPLAEVCYIQNVYAENKKISGYVIIMTNTKWDVINNNWANSCYFDKLEGLNFIEAWEKYREGVEAKEKKD